MPLSSAYTLIPYCDGLISYICKSLCKILLEVIYILDAHADSYKILKYSCILLLLFCAVKTDCGARMNDKCLCVSDIAECVWNRKAVYKFKCLFLAANPDCKDCSIAVCELVFFAISLPFAATKPRIINPYVRIIVFYPRRKLECIRAFSFHSKTECLKSYNI